MREQNNISTVNVTGSFSTCVCCIDGRVHLPLVQWIKKATGVEYVDLITEPGIDAILAKEEYLPAELLRKIDFSVNRSGSIKQIFLSSHQDCLANPVSENTHRNETGKAVRQLKSHYPGVKVTGLWVANNGDVEEIEV